MRRVRIVSAASAFTLLELLTVIAIIVVLISLLLPVLGKGKERARQTVCLRNFQQIGVAFRLLLDENNGRFPRRRVRDTDPVTGVTTLKFTHYTPGGQDPLPGHFIESIPSAKARPLNPFVTSHSVFRCPSDSGLPTLPSQCYGTYCSGHHGQPTLWETIGCSYQYNAGSLVAPTTRNLEGGTRVPQEDPRNGIAGKHEGWAPDPARYILLHEPPAAIHFRCENEGMRWAQWHQNRGITSFTDPTIAPDLFISPILFVDGHAGVFNFSAELKTVPWYPYEPTKDWVWYKPAPAPLPPQ